MADISKIRFKGVEYNIKPLMDAEPTENSINAVQSGGVKSALDGLQAEIPDIDDTLTQSGQAADSKATGAAIAELKNDLISGIPIEPTWTDGARLYARTGAVDPNIAYSYFKIPLLRHNGVVTITTYARTPASSVVFYDADDVYISDVLFPSTEDYTQTITVEIPANAATLGVSCVTVYKNVFSGYYNIDASEKLVNDKIDGLAEEIATNKNSIERIDAKLSNLQIIDTKTGENVSFVSIEGAPLKQVVCQIIPVQAGTGTPSPNNVRNLTGINSLTIYHSQTDETVNTPYEYDFSATAGTVYAGELNVLTGELTVTGALFVSSASTASLWHDNPGRNGFYISIADMQTTPNYGDAKCNWLQVDKNMRDPLSICVGYNSRVVFVNNITNNLSEVTSLADWLTYLESHPLQFTYPLATPVTYQLTGYDINALAGINKMWTDSMDITVSYVIGTEDYIKDLNGWNGKKYAAIGDSITWGFTPKNTEGHRSQLKSYAALTAENLGMTFENYGIAGCTFAVLAGHETDLYPIATRWQNLPDDADLITVTGGTNDVRLGVPLGTMADRGTDTYYGAWHTVLGGLYKKYFIDQGANVGKTKKIVVITPIKLLQTPASTQGGNGVLREWESWINAIKEVAAYYSFPVLDFYNLSNINPELNGTVYDSDSGYQGYYNMYITDGVHPTQEGAEIMANVLTGFLKTLL